MSKRTKRLATEIPLFLQKYARKARKGLDPNDRDYSRDIQDAVKRMSPLEFDAIVRGETDWPFADPPNTAVFTTAEILDGREPILKVTHDLEDAAWQFLPSRLVSVEQAKIVALRSIVVQDPTVLELADLRAGWCAERNDINKPWRRHESSE